MSSRSKATAENILKTGLKDKTNKAIEEAKYFMPLSVPVILSINSVINFKEFPIAFVKEVKT